MSPSLSRTNTGSSRTTAHDRTSYGIIQTPPSPTDTSPTLTHFSTNASPPPTSSSTSSPLPSTPPRPSRTTARYPTDLGRVPLHRRGTSKTYERLEDLLREAGYKETRVFTPEGERTEAVAGRNKPEQEEDRRTSVREGVDAVVGFLSGLIPGGGPSRSSSLLRTRDDPPPQAPEQYPSLPREYSPPTSPLTRRQSQTQKQKGRTSGLATPANVNSSRESLGDPTPRPRYRPPSRAEMPPPSNAHSYSRHDPTPPHSGGHPHPRPDSYPHPHRSSNNQHVPSYASERYLRNQVSRSSLHQLQQQQGLSPNKAGPSTPLAHPRPSRAGAYLRHIASVPDIPTRPSSTPGHRSRMTILLNDNDMDERRGNGEGEEEHPQPPLPRTWLETVARAVLFGGSGAYVGGPSHAPAHLPPPKPRDNPDDRGRSQTLRATRSSLSQASRRRSRPPRHRLRDQTNTAASQDFLAPPQIFVALERGRARGSVGEVSRTRVVCRSAPGSRASSAVREQGEEKGRRAAGNGNGKGIWKGGERGRERERKEKDRFPSLAQTKTEGDAWARGRQRQRGDAVGGGNRYLSGWGADDSDEEEEEEEEGDPTERQSASSEEDDGELDLARILVPPKRQNSIKSLRKHLVGDDGSARVSSHVGRDSLRHGDRTRRPREEDWGREQEEDEEEEGWGRSWGRGKGRRNTQGEEEEEGVFAGFLGEGRGRGGADSGRSTGRGSRLGLPAVWGR